MNRSRRAGLVALGCAAVLVSGCGTLTWVSSTMNRPKTDVLGSSEHDTLTQHNDPQRSGAYLREEQLNPETVGGGKFARLFDWEVDGQIYTQPLYVSNLPYKGRNTHSRRLRQPAASPRPRLRCGTWAAVTSANRSPTTSS